MSYQITIIEGNVGRDAEMRYTPTGQAVTNFSVAVDESYTKESGEKVKKTAWFKVTTWGKLAETCNAYVKKGSKVLVQGQLTADPATGGPKIWNKQDGSAAASFDLTASVVRFLSSRTESAEPQAAQPTASTEDEFPF